MTMKNHQILGLVVLLGLLVVVNILVYWFVICRALYKHGAKFPTGFMFWRVFKDLRTYRDLCRAHCLSLSPYYCTFILSWFNLLLALGTALRALWEQTHKMQ
jgi:hypothetical protein